MTPSLTKTDIEGLKRDIPNKCPKNIPLLASEEWEFWLANTEFNLLSEPDNYTWSVDKLKNELLELKERERSSQSQR